VGCRPFPRGRVLPVHARELLLARREFLALEQAPNEGVKLLVRQRCKLQQDGVQPLQLAFRHRVEVETTNTLLGTRALQPTEENLSGAGIRNCALTQAEGCQNSDSSLNLGFDTLRALHPPMQDPGAPGDS
jgi:hypothetical protein